MTAVRSLARMLYEQPLRPKAMEGNNRALWRLFQQFFLAEHWPSLLVIVLLGSLGGLMIYVYAWTGRMVADEIVQVQLLAADRPVTDPAHPDEVRLFEFDDAVERSSLTDRMTSKPGRSLGEKLHMLGCLAIALVLAEIGRHLIQFVGGERRIQVGQKIQFRLRPKLYAKFLQLPASYHDQHSPGQLLTNLFSDLTVVQNRMIGLVQSIPSNVLAMIVGTVIVLTIDVSMAWLVLIAVPAYAVFFRWFRARMRVIDANLREREGRLNAHIANRISNFLLVKSFVHEHREAMDFIQQAKPIVQNNVAASILSTGLAAVCGIVTGLSMTAVLWMGTLRVRDGHMTLGELLMFYTSSGYMFTPMASLIGSAGTWSRLRTVAGRIMHVLDERTTITDPSRAESVPAKACEVRFEHVTMRYQTELEPALNDVSFALPPGQRLCVMGPSGSGKTTLAKLIGRLYDPCDGRICLDRIDVRRFKIADIRRLIGVVTQEPIIFSGTIGNNIRYGFQDAPQEAVVDAARFAQIHEFIEELPHRYSTLTHERGLTLSGGQKQRVNLARALLYDPKVLVLDDCTSALDAQTESQLIDAFHTVLRGRTVVLVSHRVSIALECDLVLMLDKGRIEEFGPPDQLRCGDGPFAMLNKEQQHKVRVA